MTHAEQLHTDNETQRLPILDDETATEKTSEFPPIRADGSQSFSVAQNEAIDARTAVEKSMDYERRMQRDLPLSDSLMSDCSRASAAIADERGRFMRYDAMDNEYLQGLSVFQTAFEASKAGLEAAQQDTLGFIYALKDATQWAAEAQTAAYNAYQIVTTTSSELKELGALAPGHERHLRSKRQACEAIMRQIREISADLELYRTNPNAKEPIAEEEARLANLQEYLDIEQQERELAQQQNDTTNQQMEDRMQAYDDAMKELHRIGSAFLRSREMHLTKLNEEHHVHRQKVDAKTLEMQRLLRQVVVELASLNTDGQQGGQLVEGATDLIDKVPSDLLELSEDEPSVVVGGNVRVFPVRQQQADPAYIAQFPQKVSDQLLGRQD